MSSGRRMNPGLRISSGRRMSSGLGGPARSGVALLALVFYGAHASTYLYRGEPQGLLWACHVATLLIGAGALLDAARPACIGLCWVIVGSGMWIVDLLFGDSFMPTSLLTHVGGFFLGVFTVRRLGWPRGSFLWAGLWVALLQVVTRFLTPPATNINLAFAIFPGVRRFFPSFPIYAVCNLLFGVSLFYLIERLARRLLRQRRYAGPKGSPGSEAVLS